MFCLEDSRLNSINSRHMKTTGALPITVAEDTAPTQYIFFLHIRPCTMTSSLSSIGTFNRNLLIPILSPSSPHPILCLTRPALQPFSSVFKHATLTLLHTLRRTPVIVSIGIPYRCQAPCTVGAAIGTPGGCRRISDDCGRGMGWGRRKRDEVRFWTK
jgi:hypothetical protein